MNKRLLKIAASLVLPAMALTGVNESAAANVPSALAKYGETDAWGKMLRAKELRQANGPMSVGAQDVLNQLAKSGSNTGNPAFDGVIPADFKKCHGVGWISLPQNKGYWYYAVNYTYTSLGQNDNTISGFKLSIFNEKFEKVTTINGETPTEGDETRIVQVDVADYVTKKYFKSDDNYEIAINVAANTPRYVNNYRTLIYSIDPSKADSTAVTQPMLTIPGLIVDVADATDTSSAWASENYYFTFMQEGYVDADDNFTVASAVASDSVNGRTAVYQYKVAKKAGYGDFVLDNQTVKTLNVQAELATYTSGVNFITKYNAPTKEFFFGPVYYSKPFLNDAYDGGSEEPFLTPDNAFNLNLWKVGSYGPASEVGTMSIPCDEPTSEGYDIKFKIYSTGLLEYTEDLKIGLWTGAGEPSLTVTTEEADFSSESYPTSYLVFNMQGEQIKAIAENTSAAWVLEAVNGYPAQCVYGSEDNGDQIFNFVNLDADLTKVLTLNASSFNGNNLTNELTRVAVGNGYNYVVTLGQYENNADGVLCKVIDWIDEDGDVVHHDLIDAGGDNMGIVVNVSPEALVPYTYATDDVRCYACFVKRLQADNTIETSLAIIDSNCKVLLEKGTTEHGIVISAAVFNTPTNKALWIMYVNTSTSEYTCEFFDLPLKKFAKGGEGTAENPYKIATAGDLAQVQNYPSAHFVVVNDIDCSASVLTHNGSQFTGTFDGCGHVLSNVRLGGTNPSLFGKLSGATVKNVVINRANIDLSEGTTSALLATNADNATISGVHVYGLKAVSETNECTFGGLVAVLSSSSVMEGCSVNNAEISLTNDYNENVGGLVGQMTSSAAVKSCAFNGKLTGYVYVGGIAGTSVAARAVEDEEAPAPNVISNCHVNATISAANTVGGIVGTTGRIDMTNNFVEGTIAATENSRWNGPVIGGLIGELEPSAEGVSKTITGNVVAVSALTYTAAEGEGMGWANRNKTAHRLVGASIFSANPDEYTTIAEPSLDNNYVNSAIAVVDTTIGAGVATVEGADVALADIKKDFLKGLGWAYGSEVAAPWCEDAAELAHLYFEEQAKAIVVSSQTVEIEVGEWADIVFELVGGEENGMTLEQNGESVNAAVVSLNNVVQVAVEGVAVGQSTITASAGSLSVTVTINVKEPASVADLVADNAALSFDGATVKGDGAISVYNISGVMVAQGVDAVSVENLAAGIYVATANGEQIKIAVK